MKVRVTLEFTVSESDIEEAGKHGVERENMAQTGADNIAAVLTQIGLVPESAVGVEVDA